MSTWAHVSSRMGEVRSETRSIAKEVYEAAKDEGHDVWFLWGMGTSAEHRTGRAIDFMVRNRDAGDWVRNYLWKNRKRLRLHHVIWEQHITSTTVRPGVRVLMEDRGNPTANHYDHVHALYFAGEYRAPSDENSNDLKLGSTGAAVRKLQQFFRSVFPGYRHSVSYQPHRMIEVDGIFGHQTVAWVKEFQGRVGLRKTGVVNSETVRQLRRYGYK